MLGGCLSMHREDCNGRIFFVPPIRYYDLHNAHIQGLLACTHSSVAPKFAHDLPSCYIPQHHRLVSATRTEMAVVKGAGGREKEGQYPLMILASEFLIPAWPGSHPAASSTS